MAQWMRFCVVVFLWLAASLSPHAAAKGCPDAGWPLWQSFRSHFIDTRSGRVIDARTPNHYTTSEGQAYAMFFALVANDPDTFEQVWHWSVDNLWQGDLHHRLPAWLWGRTDQGSWQIVDSNSAADADLWFAYALLEAGRIWQRPDYIRAADQIIKLVVRHELARLPGWGVMLLPGVAGFGPVDGVWRLNPSYLPLPVLRRLQSHDSDGPWAQIANNTASMLEAVTPHRVVADWVAFDSNMGKAGFITDPVSGDTGSYDAIRVYLWAGLTSSDDLLAQQVLNAVAGMVPLSRANKQGFPPERVRAASGEAVGQGPFGFSAALLPYFSRLNETRLLRQNASRVDEELSRTLAASKSGGKALPYYNFVLTLFGQGWHEERFRFSENGYLQRGMQEGCE